MNISVVQRHDLLLKLFSFEEVGSFFLSHTEALPWREKSSGIRQSIDKKRQGLETLSLSLVCLMPDDFTRQGRALWVGKKETSYFLKTKKLE